jgi:hypothetical protein
MSDSAAFPDSGTFNPYSAPEESGDFPTSLSALSDRDHRCLTVGQVVVTWEKLRILYNGILGVEAIFVFFAGWSMGNNPGDILESLLLGALIANLCFCAGPVIDGYLSWFGFRSRAITWVIFLIGLGIAVLLGLAFLMTLAMAGMFPAID